MVKKGQASIPEKNLPLVCLAFATSPDAGTLSSVVLVKTDTNEEFVADISSLFGPHPSMFTKEEEPRRALSMIVIHLAEGRYRLKEVQLEGARGKTYLFDLTNATRYFVTVKAKRVNYVGTLVLSAVWQQVAASRGGTFPTYFIIENTCRHDQAWAEQEVPGLAQMESAASVIEHEDPPAKPGAPVEAAEISFPVTAQTKLVVTFPIKFLSPPNSFTAEPGVFAATLETEDGVYFPAPQGLQFGDDAHPDRKEGGIFLPKSKAKDKRAGFYVGKPPAADIDSQSWGNLFLQEGVRWRLEQPAAPAPECTADWKAIVTNWVASLEKGKWRLQQCEDPAYRYSQPAGWLVSQVAERTGRISADEYGTITLLAVIADGNVRWRMLTARILDTGQMKMVVPLSHPRWEPATK